MNKSQDKNFLEKLKKRNKDNLKVKEVYKNSTLSNETYNYLKKQKYLDFSKIEIILKNSFDANSPFGNVLLNHKNEIIGFLGTMISLQTASNKNYKLCNLHTWIVDEKYRLNSYLLLLPLLELSYVITTFTPLKTLIGLYEKFGFKKVKMNYRMVFLFNFLSAINFKKFSIELDYNSFSRYLSDEEDQIYKDHKNLSCLKFFITDKFNTNKNSFVIALIKKKKIFSSLDLIYASNPKFLRDNWSYLSLSMAFKFKVFFAGQNFINENEIAIPNNVLIAKDFCKDICVKNLPAEYKFDTLYSEFVY